MVEHRRVAARDGISSGSQWEFGRVAETGRGSNECEHGGESRACRTTGQKGSGGASLATIALTARHLYLLGCLAPTIVESLQDQTQVNEKMGNARLSIGCVESDFNKRHRSKSWPRAKSVKAVPAPFGLELIDLAAACARGSGQKTLGLDCANAGTRAIQSGEVLGLLLRDRHLRL